MDLVQNDNMQLVHIQIQLLLILVYLMWLNYTTNTVGTAGNLIMEKDIKWLQTGGGSGAKVEFELFHSPHTVHQTIELLTLE